MACGKVVAPCPWVQDSPTQASGVEGTECRVEVKDNQTWAQGSMGWSHRRGGKRVRVAFSWEGVKDNRVRQVGTEGGPERVVPIP